VAVDDRDLVGAAREGDERAFVELTSPHRAALHAHCYRLLGSLHDADDALQETLLRAWRGIARFEPRSPVAAWLYRIATNVSLRMIEQRQRRDAMPIDAHLEPYPQSLVATGSGPATSAESREATVPLDGRIDRIRLLPARANGQPALAACAEDEETGQHEAYGVMVFAIAGGRIAGITGFPRRPASGDSTCR
jgi:RNA polymerase sigma factor (sigma-70 family)